MKKTFFFSTAVAMLGTTAMANDAVLMSWGGSYGRSQIEAYIKPFQEQFGKTIVMVDSDNPATPIKAMVEAGNVTIDIADVEMADAVRLCDEGLLEVLAIDELPDGDDGTPAAEDFVNGSLVSDCAVPNIVWSTVVAYNRDRVNGTPTSLADFFDLETFPGKRGLRKDPKNLLEQALMADGVPAADVYDLLTTSEGVSRAFAKLDTIKSEVVWWEAGAQPPQLLADGEVVMSTAYNGRIFNAVVEENQPFEIIWDGQIMDFDLFVIPKGASNKDTAWEFIKFATDTQRLAGQASWISYGPARKSSAPFVSLFSDGETEMAPHMPTAPNNLANALPNGFEFWADRQVELTERFNAWLLR